ncbi:MAG: hypothetical protein VXZ82_18280 [Planctomycetota bacterium]|nr:hypothetical protein [Planctomycetota bacterium]
MDPVKRKVISELFFAPSVVLPLVGGLSAGILSWAMAGNSYLTGAAMAGILGGVGWMFTRMLFKVEDITEKAMAAEAQKKRKSQDQELDELASKLRTDRDHRTQDYLTLLRSLQEEFEEAAQKPGAHFRSVKMSDQINEVLKAAAEQLEQSYKLWDLSQNLVGDARDKVLDSREQVLTEIQETVDHLTSAAKQIKQVIETDNKVDLATMREELETTMRIAKRTEERMKELENTNAKHEEFLKE